MGKPEGKISFGRPRHGGEFNVNMDFQEIGCEDMVRINLAKNRDLVGCCECGKESWHSLKIGNFVMS